MCLIGMFCCHYSFIFVPCNVCFQVFSRANLSTLYSISCRYFPFRPFIGVPLRAFRMTWLVITIQFRPQILQWKSFFSKFSLFSSIHNSECTQVCSRFTGMLWSCLLSINAWSPANRFEPMYHPLIDLLFFPQALRSGLPNDPASISVLSMCPTLSISTSWPSHGNLIIALHWHLCCGTTTFAVWKQQLQQLIRSTAFWSSHGKENI